MGGVPYSGTGTSDGGETEKWDGTSWTTTARMTLGQQSLAGCGTTSLGLAFSGNPDRDSTEEFTAGTTTVNAAKIIDFD